MIKQLKTIIDALNEIVIELESKPHPSQEALPMVEKKTKSKKVVEEKTEFPKEPEALDEGDLIMPDTKAAKLSVTDIVARLRGLRDSQGPKVVADFLSRFEIKSVKEINDSHIIEMDKFLKEVCKC